MTFYHRRETNDPEGFVVVGGERDSLNELHIGRTRRRKRTIPAIVGLHWIFAIVVPGTQPQFFTNRFVLDASRPYGLIFPIKILLNKRKKRIEEENEVAEEPQQAESAAADGAEKD